MKRYNFKVFLVVLLQFLFVGRSFGQTNKMEERNQLISKLNNLKARPVKTVLAVLDSAEVFAQKGDTLVLSALINLTYKSDGYVSEALGTILGELFLHKTDYFLNYLLTRNEDQQKHIATMAFYMDGGGMRPDDFNKLELKLKKLKKRKEIKMVKLANVCLLVLYEVKKDVYN
jgi:hypothetical protein